MSDAVLYCGDCQEPMVYGPGDAVSFSKSIVVRCRQCFRRSQPTKAKFEIKVEKGIGTYNTSSLFSSFEEQMNRHGRDGWEPWHMEDDDPEFETATVYFRRRVNEQTTV